MPDRGDTRSRDERVAAWRSGIPLEIAWLKFGESRMKAEHGQKRGTDAGWAVSILMMGGLFDRLANGELVAFGYCVRPIATDGPVQIPSDLFAVNPDRDAPFGGIVETSGWTYERVRVVLASHPVTTAEQGSEPTLISGPPTVLGGRSGPKPGGGELRRIYAELLASGTIPAEHTLKAAWRSVCEHVAASGSAQFKNGRGLSYPTFAREVRRTTDT